MPKQRTAKVPRTDRLPASGYPHEQPVPEPPKLPGHGRPDEPQNDPSQKPGKDRVENA